MLLSMSCLVKTVNEHVHEEVKKGMTKKKCEGKLYSLTEAHGGSTELLANSQVYRLYWDEIRHQNNRCSCPMTKHSRRLYPNSIPLRRYRVFNSAGLQLEGYKPGLCGATPVLLSNDSHKK